MSKWHLLLAWGICYHNAGIMRENIQLPATVARNLVLVVLVVTQRKGDYYLDPEIIQQATYMALS